MTGAPLTAVPTGVDAAVAVVGVATIGLLAGFVRRDASRIGLDRPSLWAGIVAGSCAIGLVTYLFVPTVPIPGLLVVALVGPVVYLFEREDAAEGDAPAHPHALPNGSDDESSAQAAETREE